MDHGKKLDDVKAIFNEFDTDGNGRIQREELAALLMVVDPESFDDVKINELLSNIDCDGDRAISVTEFINWVFAGSATAEKVMKLVASRLPRARTCCKGVAGTGILDIHVPEGVEAGEAISFEFNGQEFEYIVPQDAVPGDVFSATLKDLIKVWRIYQNSGPVDSPEDIELEVELNVPEGSESGEMLCFELVDGDRDVGEIEVVIPEGAVPGDVLRVLVGSGASASPDASHLAEYFRKLQKATEVSEEDGVGYFRKRGDRDGKNGGRYDEIKRMGQDMKKWYEQEGKPCLIKAFEHHDKDKTKALENDDAKVFFLNLIQEQEVFTLAMAQEMQHREVELMVDEMKLYLPIERAEEATEYRDWPQHKDKMDALKKDLDKRIASYKTNKQSLDENAFKVMDTNSDGKIQLEEILATFEPRSVKYSELLVALGFMTSQEKLKRETFKRFAEGDGNCAQQ